MTRSDELREAYGLTPHPEGGAFAEVYASAAQTEGRGCAGSIYFLLSGAEISHLHEIDCEEVWYYHEGCGLKLTLVDGAGNVETALLGGDLRRGQRHMLVVPRGVWFASENIDKDGYTLVSCATAPRFRYEGFRLIGRAELAARCGDGAQDLQYLIREEEA